MTPTHPGDWSRLGPSRKAHARFGVLPTLMQWCALLSIAALIPGHGCDSSTDKQTLRGLQEENRVLKESIANLQEQAQAIKTDRLADVTALKKAQQEELGKLRELQREKTSQLEQTVADLRLELSSTQRERLALQAIVDQRPRVQDAVQVRLGIERLVWLVFLVCALAALMLIAGKYVRLQRQIAQSVLQQATLIQRMKEEPA
jgi:hypothetical protein